MPKARRHRQKYHESTKKNVEEDDVSMDEEAEAVAPESEIPSEIQSMNDELAVRAREKQEHLKKIEKRKMKKERFLSKLTATSVTREAEKKKAEEKAKSKVSTQSLTAFSDMINSLNSVDAEEQSRPKPNSITTEQQKQKVLKTEMDHFKKVIQHKGFQSNPLSILSQHLTNTVAAQKQAEFKVKREQKRKDKIAKQTTKTKEEQFNKRWGSGKNLANMQM